MQLKRDREPQLVEKFYVLEHFITTFFLWCHNEFVKSQSSSKQGKSIAHHEILGSALPFPPPAAGQYQFHQPAPGSSFAAANSITAGARWLHQPRDRLKLTRSGDPCPSRRSVAPLFIKIVSIIIIICILIVLVSKIVILFTYNIISITIITIVPGGYAVVATSDHASDSLAESAFPLHGSDDLVNWQPKVITITTTIIT